MFNRQLTAINGGQNSYYEMFLTAIYMAFTGVPLYIRDKEING